MEEKNNYISLAEKTYSRSFWSVCIFIIISLSLIFVIRRNPEADLIHFIEITYNFVEHVLWVFAVPVSIQIMGNTLPYISKIISAFKSISEVKEGE